jgi:hypothetical protein
MKLKHVALIAMVATLVILGAIFWPQKFEGESLSPEMLGPAHGVFYKTPGHNGIFVAEISNGYTTVLIVGITHSRITECMMINIGSGHISDFDGALTCQFFWRAGWAQGRVWFREHWRKFCIANSAEFENLPLPWEVNEPNCMFKPDQ